MKTPIKVVLADDQPLFLEGLKMILKGCDEIEITGEALNGVQLLYLVKELQPDVVVTDIEMPEMDGVEAMQRLKASYPQLGVIALTVFREDWRVMDMLHAGARGYLLKNSSREDLITAIRSVHAGGYYFCNSTSMRLSQLLAESVLPVMRTNEAEVLNETEKRIVVMICQQYSSKQIAGELRLQSKTIENYRTRIIEKTGMSNMAGVVVYAIRKGLFRP